MLPTEIRLAKSTDFWKKMTCKRAGPLRTFWKTGSSDLHPMLKSTSPLKSPEGYRYLLYYFQTIDCQA